MEQIIKKVERVKNKILKIDNTSQGFTLIELLIVISIMAIATFFIAPRLSNQRDINDISFVASDIQSKLLLAKSNSVAKNKPVNFTLNTENRFYKIDEDDQAYIPERIHIEFLLGSTLASSSSAGNIIFFPDGTATGGKITLNQDEKTQVIEVHWLTGKVSNAK